MNEPIELARDTQCTVLLIEIKPGYYSKTLQCNLCSLRQNTIAKFTYHVRHHCRIGENKSFKLSQELEYEFKQATQPPLTTQLTVSHDGFHNSYNIEDENIHRDDNVLNDTECSYTDIEYSTDGESCVDLEYSTDDDESSSSDNGFEYAESYHQSNGNFQNFSNSYSSAHSPDFYPYNNEIDVILCAGLFQADKKFSESQIQIFLNMLQLVLKSVCRGTNVEPPSIPSCRCLKNVNNVSLTFRDTKRPCLRF